MIKAEATDMKLFFTTSLVTLAIFIGSVGTVSYAHAQFDSSESIEDSLSRNEATDAEKKAAIVPVDPAAANTKTPLPPGPPDDSIFAKVMQWIMSLFAWLVGVAAITLDNAVYYTVVTMGTYIKDLSAIGVTWQILRDIGNIVIIFGFLAIGISTILNVNWYGGGFKMLPKLLVAAVFLNFSLFLSMAVIDAGNLFATQFYTQINGGKPAGAKNFDLVSVKNEGISNKIMGQLGLQTIYGNAITNPQVFKSGNAFIIGFMGSLVFLITAFVLFSLAFILIARFIILIFLIIIAPIGFAGLAIPQLKNTADKWWSTLFEQTITAPILLLLLYIALAVITDVQFLTGFGVAEGLKTSDNFWTGFIDNGNLAGFAGIMLSFLVAMGLLLAVVILSKKLSAFGGDWATGMAGKLSFGATAFVGRRTVGRMSNFAARSIRSTGFGQSEAGRLIAGGLDRGAKASFDVRGIKAGGGLKALGGIDAGEAQKGGYRAREDELVKVRTDYAKTLKQTNAQTDENKKILGPLKEQEEKQLAASKVLIDRSKDDLKAQRTRVQDARSSGDKTRFEAEAKVLDSMTAVHKELRETEAEKLEPIRGKIKDEDKRFKSAAQTKYAESLEKKRILLRPYDVITATGSARREAASKILKDSKKGDVDKIKEWIESEEGRRATSPTSSATPPPPTPPTGSSST